MACACADISSEAAVEHSVAISFQPSFHAQAQASRSVTDRPQRSNRHEHYRDFSAPGGLDQFLPTFSLGRTGANLTDLHGDRPAAAGGINPHGAALHR